MRHRAVGRAQCPAGGGAQVQGEDHKARGGFGIHQGCPPRVRTRVLVRPGGALAPKPCQGGCGSLMSVIADFLNRLRLSGLTKSLQQMTGLISILHLSKVESGSGRYLFQYFFFQYIYIFLCLPSLTPPERTFSRARGIFCVYRAPEYLFVYRGTPIERRS